MAYDVSFSRDKVHHVKASIVTCIDFIYDREDMEGTLGDRMRNIRHIREVDAPRGAVGGARDASVSAETLLTVSTPVRISRPH